MLSAFSAQAQDDAGTQAAQQAAQQAMQQAQQQMQQLQQDTQRASDEATRQTMQNLSDASNSVNNTTWCCAFAAKPTFSVKPGTYSGTTTVKIRDNTRGAVIYYTTDGWTPTTASTRYTGPVTIDATTTLNAIAIVPGPFSRRSLVASAQYTISGTQSGTAKASAAASVAAFTETGSAILRQGTPVHLVFATDVNSKTADVGDKIQLTLAEEIKAGDMVLIAKGAHATATVTQVDKTGAGGAPGNLVFQVDSLDANGNAVKLQGSATLEGQPKPPNAAIMVPYVGLFTLFRHGKDAEIKSGTPVTAYVDADTSLSTANWGSPPIN
jgi:chitobiase/beta-hexosaminidase-like protein